MTKLEAALHVLFADNLAELDNEHDVDVVADALAVRLPGTDHWSTLRDAAKATLLITLVELRQKAAVATDLTDSSRNHS